ncbi:MAG: DEAD/DEAH box helicase [Caldiserica bacterium]|jgi:ATP-dependent Lhr-like helicase|nr:DEAD/DEAH box helicase [Caldisericota bacterium]MDH7563157.1 DEAD/DEAH box helicase [Caldisericota bacterium]
MNENPFFKLAPFIQEFIFAHGWTELRAVQVEACRVIFDTDAHLLLATGTASGKTEAAFLPILTLLHQDPPQSVGVLYLGPTKALINDQFQRLNELLKEAEIPVFHWHGDVPLSEKMRVLTEPKGVLQITPESMEALLMHRKTDLMKIFGDLRFVVIDEVHVFMNSDRGRQILAQLGRLKPYLRKEPRRVGLSATLGDYSEVEEWLRQGTSRPVITPKVGTGEQKIRLALEHFFLLKGTDGKGSVKEDKVINPYYEFIFDHSLNRKCLIFSNSKEEAESMLSSLRMVAKTKKSPDFYYMHHGSISAPLREDAEDTLKDPTIPAIVAATTTLELGIDVGPLERIIQLEAPYSVSSFLQRLGRSGRRGNPQEMVMVFREEEPIGDELLPQQFPWSFLQGIALIQLYLEERWIEPLRPVRFPFSLLYHQTMAILASQGELRFSELADRVLQLPPFLQVPVEDLKELVGHLLAIDHLERTEEGGLIVGLKGEEIVRSFRFYAVFQDEDEYTVKDGSREIGSVAFPPPPGERFGLAGRTWEVLEVDPRHKVILVRGVEGKALTTWPGPSGVIHTRIKQRMKQALLEDVDYPYLQPNARQRLKEARNLARMVGLEKNHILPLGGRTFALFPWLGTRSFRVMSRVLKRLLASEFKITNVEGEPSNYLIFKMEKGDQEELNRRLVSLAREGISPESLLGTNEAPIMQKFDPFLPPKLLRKAFAYDHLDVEEFCQIVGNW